MTKMDETPLRYRIKKKLEYGEAVNAVDMKKSYCFIKKLELIHDMFCSCDHTEQDGQIYMINNSPPTI